MTNFKVEGSLDICVSRDLEASAIRMSLGIGSQTTGVRIDYFLDELGVNLELQVKLSQMHIQQDFNSAGAVMKDAQELWSIRNEYGDLWYSSGPRFAPSSI